MVVNDGTVDSQPATVSVTVTVGVAGLLAPLGVLVPALGTEPVPLPDKAFKVGRTLPLRLQQSCGITALTDVDVAAPQIVRLVKTGEPVDLELTDPDSGEANDTGTLFRYSDPNWVFNLSTKTLGLTSGTYEITISMPDGQLYTTSLVLK